MGIFDGSLILGVPPCLLTSMFLAQLLQAPKLVKGEKLNFEESDDLLLLAEGILEDIELERRRLSSVVRRCLRLSRLVEDREASLWFGLELDGFSKDNLPPNGSAVGFDRLLLRSARVFTREEVDLGQKRAYINKLSLVEMEERIRELKEELTQTRYPADLFYPREYAPPVERALNRIDRERLNVSRQLTEYLLVYERVKGKIYNWVWGTWTSLNFARLPQHYLSLIQKMVESELKEICPLAISQLVSTYKGLKEREGDWSELVAETGKLLRAFTDGVSPYQEGPIEGEDGLRRRLAPEQYFLRLADLIRERTEPGPRRNLLLAQLKGLEDRLEVFLHPPPQPDRDDAHLCLIQAYLLLGELLKLIR